LDVLDPPVGDVADDGDLDGLSQGVQDIHCCLSVSVTAELRRRIRDNWISANSSVGRRLKPVCPGKLQRSARDLLR
jgi:hypothetical protein